MVASKSNIGLANTKLSCLAGQPFGDHHQREPSGDTPNPVITMGPMLGYVFLSVFALLLLTACGGSDLDKLIETKECVECDLPGADLKDED